MPMPRWVAKTNRRFVNPRAIDNPKWGVLAHRGRVSGEIHRTPLDVTPVDGGFLFFVIYGPRTDWLRNVLASGDASVTHEGEDYQLTNPRVVDKATAVRLAGEGVAFPPAWAGVSEFLVMDRT